jgi:hypothetical protein
LAQLPVECTFLNIFYDIVSAHQKTSCCKKTCDEVDLTGFGNLSGLKIRNAHIFVKMSSQENLQQEFTSVYASRIILEN